MVKRYDPELRYIGTGEYAPDMQESPHGDWVEHEDYVALRSDLARERERRERLEGALRGLKGQLIEDCDLATKDGKCPSTHCKATGCYEVYLIDRVLTPPAED
jgi:hypothetical protein